MLRSLTQLLLLLCLAPIVVGQNSAPVLTNCVDILKLAPEQAKENRPARLRGTVTCYNPGSQLCFIQDATAGIYVLPAPWPKELLVGDVVEVEGVTAEGRFSPIIQWGSIRPTGQKATLTPRRISLEELATGRFDCQFVELDGVVQSAAVRADTVRLELGVGFSSAAILIFDVNPALTNSVDALVRVRGVAGTFYANDQLSGFGLFLQDASFLETLRPAPEPFSQPLRTTAKLGWYSPEGALNHRIRLQGTVTLSWPRQSFFLQDKFGPLRIKPAHPAQMPQPGDIVEVTGFVRDPASRGAMLVNALWKKTGAAAVPAPVLAHITDLLAAAPKGQLISAEAILLGASGTGAVTTVFLEEKGHAIRAYNKEPMDPALLGSTVRVTGVLSSPPGETHATAEPCLWLAPTNAITVLHKPPLGASGQSSGLLIAIGLALTLLLAACAWIATKNSRHARSVADAQIDQINAAEKEIARLKEARERLGRDLHDHIIQSIYAVGLNLEECRQILADPARAGARLQTTLTEINEVIRELRNVILGLETNTIQPQEFRTALKSLALTLGHEKSNRIRLDINQAALDSLSPAQATELIHIAREAMSNSLRHGHAQTTTLTLQPFHDGLRFSVEDDGKGFNPETADGTGYGLRNMAKRSEDLGAKFTITAQEGLGTRIVLDIPKQKQHFSPSEPRSRINR